MTQFELLPQPPVEENKPLTWPYWPMKLRTSSFHEEGRRRDWAVVTREFIGESGRVTKLKAVRVEWTEGKMREIPGSEFELKAIQYADIAVTGSNVVFHYDRPCLRNDSLVPFRRFCCYHAPGDDRRGGCGIVNTVFDIQCEAATCRPEAGDDCAAHGICALRAFARTDPSVFDRISKQRRLFRRGEILFHAGQPFSYVCAIRSGSVKSYLCSEDGEAQVTGFWFAGELLDLNGIHHDSRACVVEALETTSVCELPTDFLQQLLADVPAARLEMLKSMSAQVHGAEELIRVIETKRTDQRLAVFILEMSRRAALRGLSDSEVRLTMSHTDLASFLGMARETLSRALSRFDTDGLIVGRGEVILIRDSDALRALSRS